MKTKLIIVICVLSAISLTAQSQEPNFGDLFLMMNEESSAGSSRDSDRGGIGGVRQGSGGGGELELAINIDWPREGKMLAMPSKLAWQSLPGVAISLYEVLITNTTDDTEVYRAIVDAEELILPLDALQSMAGNSYTVEVLSSGEDEGLTSQKAVFTLVSPMLYHKAMSSVKNAEQYEGASDLELISMKAFSLESSGLKYQANKLYKEEMQTKYDQLALDHLARLFRERAGISCLCL